MSKRNVIIGIGTAIVVAGGAAAYFGGKAGSESAAGTVAPAVRYKGDKGVEAGPKGSGPGSATPMAGEQQGQAVGAGSTDGQIRSGSIIVPKDRVTE